MAAASAAAVVGALALPATATAADEDATILATTLHGEREISPEGARGAGDLDAYGQALFSVSADEICFELFATGTDLPAAAAHIHAGEEGVNGPVVVGLTAPGADGRASGCVAVAEDVSGAILDDPAGYYANVHTAAFPNGAVRGNLNMAEDEPTLLGTTLNGEREISAEGERGAGDLDGTGAATVAIWEDGRLCVTISVADIALPAAAAHIHEGEIGVNGPVVVPLPTPDADGLARGCVTDVERPVLGDISANPEHFYVNVHNGEFPNGAVRGNLTAADEA